MIPRISLAAAFVLMMAPPMACASTRDVASGAPINSRAQVSQPSTVLAQDDQSSMGTTNGDSDNDNSSDSDSDSNDSDDNQNADGSQSDQNASGDSQQIPPTVLGSPDNDQNQSPQPPQINSYPQPVNPYQ
jgi:hypothetical protein